MDAEKNDRKTSTNVESPFSSQSSEKRIDIRYAQDNKGKKIEEEKK